MIGVLRQTGDLPRRRQRQPPARADRRGEARGAGPQVDAQGGVRVHRRRRRHRRDDRAPTAPASTASGSCRGCCATCPRATRRRAVRAPARVAVPAVPDRRARDGRRRGRRGGGARRRRRGRADDLLQPGVAPDGGVRARRSATRRAGSSCTGARPTTWWRASCGGPRRAAARRSWSRSTRRCSAGARTTWTSPTCRSCAARGSPSTPATRCSGGSSPPTPPSPATAEQPQADAGRAAHARAAHARVPGPVRVRAALRPRARRGADVRADLLAAVADLGGPAVPARAITTLPILLKGILHPDDAARAVEEGIDGIDRLQPRRPPGGRRDLDDRRAARRSPRRSTGAIPIVLDSGVRSGADAFKALALGATAVGIGRPYVYGLAIAGRGRRARGAAELQGRLRPHARALRLPLPSAAGPDAGRR